MKRAWILLLMCACAPARPLFTPVDVEVPVAVPLALPPITMPDFALSHIRTTDTVAEKVKAALIELHQRRAYEAELEARLAACR